MTDTYYILACLLPFIFSVEVLLLCYFGADKKYLGIKLIINTLLITILIVYNIHHQYFYELIIPIFFIFFNIGLGIYMILNRNNFKIPFRSTCSRIHFQDDIFDIYDENTL